MNTLEEFRKHGINASYCFADDSCGDWDAGYVHQQKAMDLYQANPQLQEAMQEIARGFLWTLKEQA